VSKPIQEYLEDGGAYLALGTGALYSPRGLITGLANLNLGILSDEDALISLIAVISTPRQGVARGQRGSLSFGYLMGRP